MSFENETLKYQCCGNCIVCYLLGNVKYFWGDAIRMGGEESGQVGRCSLLRQKIGVCATGIRRACFLGIKKGTLAKSQGAFNIFKSVSAIYRPTCFKISTAKLR